MPGVVSGQRDMLGDVVGSARNVRVRGERDERACSYRIDVVVLPFGDGSVPSQEVVSNLNHRFLLRRQVRLRVPGSLSIRIEPLGYASGILVILLRARCGEEKRQENRRERGRVESSTHRGGDLRTGCSKQKYTKVMNDSVGVLVREKAFSSVFFATPSGRVAAGHGAPLPPDPSAGAGVRVPDTDTSADPRRRVGRGGGQAPMQPSGTRPYAQKSAAMRTADDAPVGHRERLPRAFVRA